jgi:sialate O-acetylesterase
MRFSQALILVWAAIGGTVLAQEENEQARPAIELGVPFSDHAVLQQKMKLPVWGKSLPGGRVTIRFDGQTKTAAAGNDGSWRVVLDPMDAARLQSVNDRPEGKTMTIVCEKDGRKVVREIEDLIIGDVWLCAGQSNMAGKMRTSKSRHFPEDSIERADYPALRHMVSGQGDGWLVCSPETAPEFKKVAFFFGRRLQRDALVPVGLLVAAVGGSKIETWLNQDPNPTGGNYTRLIEPLVGYGLRGALWYQGESNAKDGRAYQPKLASLITGWRKVWGQGDFPVCYVQLPGIGTSTTDNPAQGDGRAEIRQAYFETLALKNTGMAVTIDIGDVREHPPNKYDTGVRLARVALRNDYGFMDLAVSPIYKSHKIEGGSIRVSFEGAENGLMLARKEGFLPPKPATGAKLGWLSVQGKDGAWHWADGTIDGSDLIVSSKEVEDPVAVRYAYTNHPTGPLLYNKDGQPVSPFSTIGYGPDSGC